MFWICIQYSDGTRIHHVFRRCGVFIAPGPTGSGAVLRVHGDTICGTSFSPPGDIDRVDTAWSVVLGVDSDLRLQPMDACEKCQAERVRLADGGRPRFADEGGN
jgi:hypothetical protein